MGGIVEGFPPEPAKEVVPNKLVLENEVRASSGQVCEGREETERNSIASTHVDTDRKRSGKE